MTLIGGLLLMFFAWKLIQQDDKLHKAKPCYESHDWALTHLGALAGIMGFLFTMVGFVLIFEGPAY